MSLDRVPPSAEALTAEWLTAALCREVPGAAVVDVEVFGGSDGTSSRRAVRVVYNQAGARQPGRVRSEIRPPRAHRRSSTRPSAFARKR